MAVCLPSTMACLLKAIFTSDSKRSAFLPCGQKTITGCDHTSAQSNPGTHAEIRDRGLKGNCYWQACFSRNVCHAPNSHKGTAGTALPVHCYGRNFLCIHSPLSPPGRRMNPLSLQWRLSGGQMHAWGFQNSLSIWLRADIKGQHFTYIRLHVPFNISWNLPSIWILCVSVTGEDQG